MNTKHCVYRNCGNTSTISPKITFFGFPIKDLEKCRQWTQLAGYNSINLKNKYLCEKHFNVIYISKTPRRTVLLPNAMPYQFDRERGKDENYDEEYTSEKNTSRDEILLDTVDGENDIIYSDTIELMRQNEDDGEENVETLEEPLIEDDLYTVDTKVKLSPVKTYNSTICVRTKPNEKISSNHVSLADDFSNHVTKRQKLHTSIDNIASNDTLKTVHTECNMDEDKNGQFDNDIDNTVNNPDITTFIYKGEEYIQMPKRIYLEQRAKLDADVKRFRSIFQDIKGLVNATE